MTVNLGENKTAPNAVIMNSVVTAVARNFSLIILNLQNIFIRS